jgi:hypothetical protein
LSSLPRAYVPRGASIAVGDVLPPAQGGRSAQALAAIRGPLLGRIRFVRTGPRELTFVLSDGLELRLGAVSEIRLKLAIAHRILELIGPSSGSGYVDVSVPERPVVDSANSQVGG